MRLLIDPRPPYLRWCRYGKAPGRGGRGIPGPEWIAAVRRGRPALARATSVSYRLHHGGAVIRDPVTRVDAATLARLRGTVGLLSDQNEMVFEAMSALLAELPAVPHLALCDTALFVDLPAEASAYAVPAELRNRGVRRFGGSGLLHEWAWGRSVALAGPAVRRVVSVELSDQPNMAALLEGRAMDTTIGFTAVEGIPSRTGCGDIDASVVFELRSSGLSLPEINELLSERSGFRALVGRSCTLRQMLAGGEDAGHVLARRILRYDLVRTIGAFTAVLGGVDVVAFTHEAAPEYAGFIREICTDLEFLGVRPSDPGSSADDEIVSAEGNVKVVGLRADRWRIMAARAAAFEEEV